MRTSPKSPAAASTTTGAFWRWRSPTRISTPRTAAAAPSPSTSTAATLILETHRASRYTPFGYTSFATLVSSMSDVTRILSAIEQGDPQAADELLPLVYDELRKLAAQKLAQEKPGQTLQATALVHEAYLRLVDTEKTQHWNSRGHFFAAAAEAMRRILVEAARRKQRLKHGGQHVRQHDDIEIAAPDRP